MKKKIGYVIKRDNLFLGKNIWELDIGSAKIYNSRGKAIYDASLGFNESTLDIEILKVKKDSKGVSVMETAEMHWFLDDAKKCYEIGSVNEITFSGCKKVLPTKMRNKDDSKKIDTMINNIKL